MYQRQVFNRYLTEKEEAQLFQTVRKFGSVLARRDYAWMMLARQTGLRVSPLSQLTLEDAKEALLDGHLQVRAETNKGEKPYAVYLNRTARKMLGRLIRIRREMGAPEMPDSPLIMSRNHHRMSVRGLQNSMAVWVKEARLKVKATPHWLRHTFAKRLVERSTARNPLVIVQHALGHSDINSTAIYTFPDRCELEAAMEAAR
jgi:site-specific recombinase XerD